jgi:hypothetical protein
VRVNLNRVNQALVAKMVKGVFSLPKVLQIPLADDAKRADGSEHAAVFAIQLVQAFKADAPTRPCDDVAAARGSFRTLG